MESQYDGEFSKLNDERARSENSFFDYHEKVASLIHSFSFYFFSYGGVLGYFERKHSVYIVVITYVYHDYIIWHALGNLIRTLDLIMGPYR